MADSKGGGGERLLLTDRNTIVLLERARVHVDGERVVYVTAEAGMTRTWNLPHGNVAVLMLGQGTSMTCDAARMLAEEGVHVVFTGSGGTPVHYGALTTYSPTGWMRRFYPVHSNEEASLAAARTIMETRCRIVRDVGAPVARNLFQATNLRSIDSAVDTFKERLGKVGSIEELLGYEANFSKSLYAAFAEIAEVPNFRRQNGGEADVKEATSRINSLIDHGNYMAYGVAGAALWTLGIPPSPSVLHGRTRAGGLVFDVADAFKDAIVLPAAFAYGASRRREIEGRFRGKVVELLDEKKVMAEAVGVVKQMVDAGEDVLNARGDEGA